MDYQNKCVYRMRVEEILIQGKPIPVIFEECENCNGYKTLLECSDYMDLEHMTHFKGLRLEGKI